MSYLNLSLTRGTTNINLSIEIAEAQADLIADAVTAVASSQIMGQPEPEVTP